MGKREPTLEDVVRQETGCKRQMWKGRAAHSKRALGKEPNMRQTMKRFTKLAAGYSSVTLLGPLLMLFLTPLYTRALEPADYGVVDVALTLFALVGSFFVLSMDQALSAHFFDGNDTYQRNLFTTALTYVGAAGLLMTACMVIVATPLAQTLFKDPSRRYVVYLLSISTIAGATYSVTSTALRLRMSVKHVNLLGLAFLLATMMDNVLFVLVLRMKATGIIAALTLTNLIAAGLALTLARDILGGSFSRHLLGPLVRTAASLLPGGISTLLLASADRLLLTQFVSPTDIGLYSIANKLASMMYVLSNAAWSAWWPMALEMANEPDAPRQYARMFEYFVAGSMLLSLAIGLFAADILSVFTRTVYVPAAPYALVLLIYFGPIASIFGFFQIGLYARKHTHWISILYFTSATVNIVLNLVLNPIIGVWGAVWATVIAGAILPLGAYLVGQRLLAVPYNLPRFFALTGVYLGLITAFLTVPVLNTLALKSGTLLAFALVILAAGVVSPDQLDIVHDQPIIG